MDFIDLFWREVFPSFIGKFELFYVFLNVVTIIVLLRIITILPAFAIGVRNKL